MRTIKIDLAQSRMWRMFKHVQYVLQVSVSGSNPAPLQTFPIAVTMETARRSTQTDAPRHPALGAGRQITARNMNDVAATGSLPTSRVARGPHALGGPARALAPRRLKMAARTQIDLLLFSCQVC